MDVKYLIIECWRDGTLQQQNTTALAAMIPERDRRGVEKYRMNERLVDNERWGEVLTGGKRWQDVPLSKEPKLHIGCCTAAALCSSLSIIMCDLKWLGTFLSRTDKK